MNARNVDEMVPILLTILSDSPGLNHSIISTAKDIVDRLDFAKIANSWT